MAELVGGPELEVESSEMTAMLWVPCSRGESRHHAVEVTLADVPERRLLKLRIVDTYGPDSPYWDKPYLDIPWWRPVLRYQARKEWRES